MHASSPALTATLRALHGETDVHVVASTLGDQQFARILALAPGVDPVIGALGALAGELPNLLTPDECASPALAAAVASLIGTDAGNYILGSWAEVAPAGWGASHAYALINAVRVGRCPRWAAAALIGPCDANAALLTRAGDIARAVQRWGQTTPDDPTAWMNALTPAERDRLRKALHGYPSGAVSCLPWLPEVWAADIVGRTTNLYLQFALDFYAIASPVARARHTDMLSALMHCADRFHLDVLTRLAVASRMDAAWTTVVQILHEHPDAARHVVTAAPWDDVPGEVQDAILSAANRDDVCAAIAFARGVREQPPPTRGTAARAFFAAVTPEVWTALPAETQQKWRDALDMSDAFLAVRSLGPDPAFLARAELNAALVAAVRRHIRDDRTLRHTLLPIAVRDLPPDAVPAIIAALPAPPDPVAFIQIAGGAREIPPALRDWIAAHPTPQAMAAATTVLRVVARSPADNVAACCAALAQTLKDLHAAEMDALLAALPNNVHNAFRFDRAALVSKLASPTQRDAFRQALDALVALPRAAKLPAFYALGALVAASDPDVRHQAAEGLAHALRDHGNGFLALVDALADAPRREILPLPRSGRRAAAVRAIAAADPLVAHRLAHALQSRSPTAMLDALTDAPFDVLARIWRLLPKALQQSILGDRDTLIHGVAALERANDLAYVLRAWNEDDPTVLLALRLLIDDDARRQERGVAILAQQPDMAASLLPLLREDLRALLVRDPRIVVAGADLPPLRSPTPAPVQRRRR